MNILDFYNAVSAGNIEKVREYHSEHPQLPVNRNLVYYYFGDRIIKLPLIIAFYEGRLETARYLWNNGADLDIVCQNCQKTPREFMPDGFLEGNCRIMSFQVFKDRVYEAAFNNSFSQRRQHVLERLQKGEEHIRTMYEYATNEELFCTSGTSVIKQQWSEGELRDWLHVSGDVTFEDKLKFFRNGNYLWPYILTTARQLPQ